MVNQEACILCGACTKACPVGALEVRRKRGNKHTIATGITTSGHIHIGNLREMLTADAVRRA
ncbi:MAG TPA: 4Fe-4S dicluster domain-containing protein, partial [Methanococcaceae archaeon]|nr:4Fe-4S dicluster domain-containing protein [Methanococcaceae archaeon]